MSAPDAAALTVHVAATVARLVPGLTVTDAGELVARAAPRPAALRQLDAHLAAYPDALTSGSGDVPHPVIVLAGGLAAAGYDQIRLPRCQTCSRTTHLRHRTPTGRLCDSCYRRSRAEPCADCGTIRTVDTRTDRGPLCSPCARPPEPCARCGQVRLLAARDATGGPLCQTCHQKPRRTCSGCGTVAATYAHTPTGPVCRACYVQPARTCGACGELHPIVRRATTDEPDLCARCAGRPLARCVACDQLRRCDPRAFEPLCQFCRAAGHHPAAAPTGGGPLWTPPTTTGGGRWNRPDSRTRARRRVHEHLHTALAHPDHGVAPPLEPLITAFEQVPNPASLLDWLTRRAGGRLLTDLARRAHHEPITHDLLDTYPQTYDLHHLRGVLVHTGVLPARAEYLDRIHPWLDQLLADQPPAHAALVRPYAEWHLLRRARTRAHRAEFTPSSAGWARGHILAATAFLTWLDERHTTLADATQTDVDTWLHNATQTRYLLRGFLLWAHARGQAGDLTVPPLPRSEPDVLLDEPARWQLLTRCLRDDQLPLDVRTAGGLLLLYGQFASRLTRLTAADIHHDDHDIHLHLGTVPVLLPPALAALVRAQRDATYQRVTYQHPDTATRPLFPGRNPGQPIRADVLTRRLRSHGIDTRQARNAALVAWATELPAAILADVLGLNVNTAVAWANRTRRDWTDYLAHRRTAPPPGRSNVRNTAPTE